MEGSEWSHPSLGFRTTLCAAVLRDTAWETSAFPLEHFLWSSRMIIKARLSSSGAHLVLRHVPSCLQDTCHSSKYERCPVQFLCSQNTLGQSVQSVQRQEARGLFLAQIFTNKVATFRRPHRVSALRPELSQSPFLPTTGSGLEQRGTHTTPRGRGSHFALPARMEQKGWVLGRPLVGGPLTSVPRWEKPATAHFPQAKSCLGKPTVTPGGRPESALGL